MQGIDNTVIYYYYYYVLFVDISAEKDLLLGMISTQMNTGAVTACSKRRSQSAREHQRTTYIIDSHPVCRETFKFVNRLY